MQRIPTSYQDAETYLAHGKDPIDRPAANNTRVCRLGRTQIGLQLHNTYVVTWCADGRIILQDNGWRTVTTRDRINRALVDGWSVGTDRGITYLYRGSWDSPDRYEWNGHVTINPDGTTDAAPKPKRRSTPRAAHTNPACGCAVCHRRRYVSMWRREPEPQHPEEHYGADLAEGAACRAMAHALASIQRERKGTVTA